MSGPTPLTEIKCESIACGLGSSSFVVNLLGEPRLENSRPAVESGRLRQVQTCKANWVIGKFNLKVTLELSLPLIRAG